MISQDEKIRGAVMQIALGLNESAVGCRVDDGTVILEGTISSDEHSYQLEDAARALPEVRAVQNSMMVEGFAASVDNQAEGIDLTPDFVSEAGTDDSETAVSEAEPYIPPTDPVVTTSRTKMGDVDILNGFAESADQDLDRDPRMVPRGDDELRSAVVRALRLNAGTTDLNIMAFARDGVVTLRGTVSSLDDADMAESVAASVPGVTEVLEELRIEGM